MQERYFENNGYTFKRVNKKTARAAVVNGLDVIFCPVNLRPFGYYSPECRIIAHRLNDNDPGYNKEDFEKLVNSFEYYNCIDSETGRYTAFYIPVKTVNRWNLEETTDTTTETTEIYNYNFLEV